MGGYRGASATDDAPAQLRLRNYSAVGISARIDRTTALYADASYQAGLDGRSEAWDGKIGLRVNW